MQSPDEKPQKSIPAFKLAQIGGNCKSAAFTYNRPMRRILTITLILAILLPGPAQALSIIRDAEIENTLKIYTNSTFKAAGLNPDVMHIYIINDPSINAFTVGGLNIFINTGLILRTDNSNMIIGVIAHETGHVVGGHIIKRMGEIDDLTVQTILTTLLGAAVTVAGLPDAGMAVMAGGQHVAERNFLTYSREQEVAADAAAVRFLNATHQSVKGMLRLFDILRREQTLAYGDIDPYTVNHPLSEERIEHIRSLAMSEDIPDTDKYAYLQSRMVAKLHGFLEKPDITFLKYTDESEFSLYARSIAYFQQSDFKNSFAELDKLLALKPEDPFYNELKGQFLVESGHPRDGVPYYEKANRLFPNSSLIKNELGKNLLGENRLDEAIAVLSQAAKLEHTNEETWHLLATAYGKKNDEGMTNLMLAEEANISDKNKDARKFARIAKDKLPKNSPGWLRANDILSDIKLNKKDKEDNDKDKDDK